MKKYITYKQVQIRKRVWPHGIQTRPFAKNNLQAMKAFYCFKIITKSTSPISRKKKNLLHSSNEINLASVLNKEVTCLRMMGI